MKTAVADNFDQAMSSFVGKIEDRLPDVEKLSAKQLTTILLTYHYLIEPRFIPWLYTAHKSCWGKVAKRVCADNIACEKGDNEQRLTHPKMLHEFVAPLVGVCEIDIEQLHYCERWAHDITTLTVDPIVGSQYALVLLAALENASTVFIPWMEKAAKRLELTDLTYLEVHGVADVAHAQEFVRAVKTENATMSQFYIEDAQKMFDLVELFLVGIFRGT